jgi:hypothetical protein
MLISPCELVPPAFRSVLGSDPEGGSIPKVEPPAAGYDVWHDRATFHFLTHNALIPEN